MSGYQVTDRRPIAARQQPIFGRIAGWLAARGASANGISVVGMLAGLGAGAAFYATARTDSPAWRICFFLGAILVQLRLLANLLDGMVAVARGTASAVGELYNEIPDRVSDSAALIGFGCAIGGSLPLGCAAALAAVLTAYIRAVGKSLTGVSDFCGPFAKQQRMALVTLVAVVAGCLPREWLAREIAANTLIDWTLRVIVVGSILTAVRRLRRIARTLNTAASAPGTPASR